MKTTVWYEGPSKVGTYAVRWYDPITGLKDRLRCLTFEETKKTVTQKRQWLESQRTGRADLKITPLVVFEEYLNSLALTHRASTIRIKRYALEPFLETLFAMEQLTEAGVNQWIANMQKKYKPDTISLNLRELRCFIRWCLKTKRLHENPMVNIVIPGSSFVGRRLSTDEKKQIFSVASGEFKLFLLVACETGARRGEILKAKLKDFDWQRAAWTIPKENSKTGKERTIPLSDSLLDALRAKIQMIKGESVFDHTPTWAQKNYKKALKSAGISGRVRIHDLRHTFASEWAGSRHTLKNMMGWTTDQMLSHYTHIDVEDVRRDLNRREERGNDNT